MSLSADPPLRGFQPVCTKCGLNLDEATALSEQTAMRGTKRCALHITVLGFILVERADSLPWQQRTWVLREQRDVRPS